MTSTIVRCENCGQAGARQRRVTRTVGSGPDMLVVENVPVIACPDCGESYLTAATMQALEKLKRRGSDARTGRTVGVVQFDAA